MFRKKQRLPIQFFLKKTSLQTKSSDFFVLKLFGTTNNYSRLGIIISKKVSPSAVVRNKIKRTTSDFFKKNQKQLPIKDFLLIPKHQISLKTKHEIIADLEKLLNLAK